MWLTMTLASYFLIALQIDPNRSATMENKVLSPLHYACWFNAAEAVDTLLDNKANIESCAAFGQKPLHYAVTRASVELVKVRITVSIVREGRKQGRKKGEREGRQKERKKGRKEGR